MLVAGTMLGIVLVLTCCIYARHPSYCRGRSRKALNRDGLDAAELRWEDKRRDAVASRDRDGVFGIVIYRRPLHSVLVVLHLHLHLHSTAAAPWSEIAFPAFPEQDPRKPTQGGQARSGIRAMAATLISSRLCQWGKAAWATPAQLDKELRQCHLCL
jgi:hypothetical protein